MNRLVFSSLIVLAIAGCSAVHPPPNHSARDAISQELRQAAKPAAPAPAAPVLAPEAVNNLLIPPVGAFAPLPGSSSADQRFDLSVSDAPIGQVLSGLVAGTDYSMLLKPTNTPPQPPASADGTPAPVIEDPATRKISLNLKNVTLFEALDAIRELYGYDFTMTGRRILVQPEEIQTRLYHVNYVLGQRRGVSDIQVVGGASASNSSSGSSGSGSSSSGSGYSSVQASGMSTAVKSDVWAEAEDSLRTLLGCNIPRTSAGGAGRSGSSGASSGGGSSGSTNASGGSSGGSSGSGGASRADISFPGDTSAGERTRGVDGCSGGRAITVNQMSGIVLVRGMPNELRMVEKLLRSMQLSISRQVIIEAKILDVELNADSQQGINWSVFSNGLQRFSVGGNPAAVGVNQPSSVVGSYGGTVSSNVSLGGLLGAGMIGSSAQTAFASGLGIAIQAKNFAALINFLESQGRVHVLSSPRIATMNNQKAVIKVGSEEPYVTNISGGSSNTSSGVTTTTPPSLAYQPFFAGIALDVTPQIDTDDNITLHVHSMVNSIAEKLKIALPDSDVRVPFASNTINETDSVVKAKDGQVIVIGGLMTESSSDNRGGVPGLRNAPGVGALFNKGAQSSIKRELVILLKPTVVKDPSAWVTDITATGERISAMDPRR